MAKKAEKKSRVVDWQGAVTIEGIVEVKQGLMDALNEADSVFVRLDRVDRMDIAGVQLLYAAQYEAVKKNKTFKITGNIPEKIREKLAAGGFLKNVDDKSLFGLDRQEA